MKICFLKMIVVYKWNKTNEVNQTCFILSIFTRWTLPEMLTDRNEWWWNGDEGDEMVTKSVTNRNEWWRKGDEMVTNGNEMVTDRNEWWRNGDEW